MEEEKIRDIPKIQEMINEAEDLAKFREIFPVIEPFLWLLGVDTNRLEETMEEADIDKLRSKADELAAIPDRFNDTFGEVGWIIHGGLSLEVAKQALHKSETEGFEEAEKVLVSNFDPDTVRFQLSRMAALDSFGPRMNLAYKALEDYREERYHSCIPVVLALMDGLVVDVHVEKEGVVAPFSYKDVQLEAWDSLVGHSKGLNQLHDLFTQSRKKTRTGEITVPYRNGIMHGMDLGYDNETVAAKTWAALFALGEWAAKAEQGELEPPHESEPTFLESVRDAYVSFRKAGKMREQIEEWEPRTVEVNKDIPEQGKPGDYPVGTPERALVEFLTYWKKENYGFMADSLIQPSIGETADPGNIRAEFEEFELLSYRILDVDDVGAARSDIQVELELEFGVKSIEGQASATLIRLDEEGSPALRDIDKGEWSITNRVVLLTPD